MYRVARNFYDKLNRLIVYYNNSLKKKIRTLVKKNLILFIKIIYISNYNVKICMLFFLMK